MDCSEVCSEEECVSRARTRYQPRLLSERDRRSSRDISRRNSITARLKATRDALLRHRWREAAELFIACVEMLEFVTLKAEPMIAQVVWRLGTEVLHHLPKAKAEDFHFLHEHLKNIGVRNFAKITLEQCFHWLLSGEVEEARSRTTTSSGWKHGRQTEVQALELKLLRGYSGFLSFLLWSERRAEALVNESEVNSCFRQASVNLQEIIKEPGVWDPFVLAYVTMLECHHEDAEALNCLENYAYNTDFPVNPNAHVYLYQHLKRRHAPESKRRSCLRILHTLAPDHELMLDLAALLQISLAEDDLKEALKVYMDLLEFPVWRSDVMVWKSLMDLTEHLQRGRSESLVLRSEWRSRESLWFPLHFTINILKKEMEEDRRELLHVKKYIIYCFTGTKTLYYHLASKCPKPPNLRIPDQRKNRTCLTKKGERKRKIKRKAQA